jgi:hypothetical protein
VLNTPLGEIMDMGFGELLAWHDEAVRIARAK